MSERGIQVELTDASDFFGDPVMEVFQEEGRYVVKVTGAASIAHTLAAAALEAMSRFAADPRWLVYLPPTMAPVATSSVEGLLEHPGEAFAAYRQEGVASVICQEKHMGSRAIIVVGRDREAVARGRRCRDSRHRERRPSSA